MESAMTKSVHDYLASVTRGAVQGYVIGWAMHNQAVSLARERFEHEATKEKPDRTRLDRFGVSERKAYVALKAHLALANEETIAFLKSIERPEGWQL